MRGGSGADGEDAEGDALPVVPRGYGRCTRSDEGGDVAEGVAGDAERFQKVAETARQFQRGDVQEGGVGSSKGGEGADRHAGAGGVGVQVIGQNVQLNTMSLGDLDKQIMEIAKRIGPEAQKLVEGELVTDGGKRKRGGGVSDSAGTATGSGSAAGNAQGAAKT